AEQAIALYKRELRPLIRQADLYHVSARPDGEHWDGMEYWDPAQGKGAVFVFRGSTPVESAHRFQLAGLKPAARYQLHFQDGSSPDRTATGRELMQDGLKVALPMPLSSEIVFVTDEAGAPVAPRGHTTKRRR
ncbi:MAG TPA: GH36 C-terminal domain-containing protein, partial [Terracidiphilus sp.]